MGAALKQTENEFDIVADKIAKLYDNAEKLLEVASHESVVEDDEFIARIEAVVNQIEESANTVSKDFADVVEKGQEPTNAMKRRVSSALRKILLAVEEFRSEVNTKKEEV